MKTKIAYKTFIILLFALLFGFPSFSQRERIELLGADELEGVMYKGQKANFLNGNVNIKHSSSLMSCNKAYMFVGVNNFDAFGNIVIRQNNGTTIYGDSLFYNGDTKIAKLRGNVKVIDKATTLNTQFLDYNMSNKTAVFFGGGTILDNGSRLESRTGTMNSGQSFYTFKGDVNIYKDNYHIVSDTLKYMTKTSIAYFYGPTHIYSKDQTLYCELGTFDTQQDKAWFNKNSWVQTPTYKFAADSLYFDNKKDFGTMTRNVKIESLKNNTIVFGDKAIKNGKKQSNIVFGNALMISKSEKDTTYIKADTLYSIEDTINKKSEVRAIRNVRVIKNDISAYSDSMVYNSLDSTIFFYKDPILWTGQNQLTGDTIRIYMKNNQVDYMDILKNGFIISQLPQDSSKYNQIKGKNLKALFINGDITQLNVNEAGRSVYYAYDEEEAYIGVNDVTCRVMKLMVEGGNMRMVKFYDKPSASFTPPSMVDESKTKLDGYHWMIAKKPRLEDFIPQDTKNQVIEKKESSLSKDKKPKDEVKKNDKKTKKELKKEKKKANKE